MYNNKAIYESSLVEKFKKYVNNGLFNMEKEFINDFSNTINSSNFLDIGIGCGRTTAIFSKLVNNYTGIDYSNNMIKNAKILFPDLNLKVCDAKNMSIFQDNTFDIIMFSFNGIDYNNHEDRLLILREINRILKSNGLFFISSHNLNSDEENIKNINNIEYYNYYCIKDSINDNLLTYYIKPSEFIKQLKNTGFTTKHVYGYSGEKIDDWDNIPRNNYWPYFLSVKE